MDKSLPINNKQLKIIKVIDIPENEKDILFKMYQSTYSNAGQEDGLLVSRKWDERTEESFRKLTGGSKEGEAWQEFYGEVEKFAQRIAPTLLEPLKSRAELNTHISMPQTWDYLIENPIGNVIVDKFKNDLVRGVVLTDALIGTLSSAYGMQANGWRNSFELVVRSDGSYFSKWSSRVFD